MTISIWVNPENLNHFIDTVKYFENGYSISNTEFNKLNGTFSVIQNLEWAHVQISSLIYYKLLDYYA